MHCDTYDIIYHTQNWAGGWTIPTVDRVPCSDMFMLPRDLP